jgi:Oligosaccharide biosynthesis protein Alg14 like
MKEVKKRLCVGASSGGHMSELEGLLAFQQRWPLQPCAVVATLGISANGLPPDTRHYLIGECDRNHLWQAIATLIRCFRVVWRERPDVVLTTGSMPLALFCLVAKLFGAHIVWIDSISQIDRISMSGRLVRPFADLFLVQWPELEVSYPGVRYAGELM